jgi:hypothetical protein
LLVNKALLTIMAMNLRRRLSSIVAPFTVSRPVQPRIVVESSYVNEKADYEEQDEDEATSYNDSSSRKSYELSDTTSRRSFDTSRAGSDDASDDDSQELYRGLTTHGIPKKKSWKSVTSTI